MDREQLRQLLNQHFNDNELSGLCFRLSIDSENIPGRNKDEKIRELIAFCERDNRVPELLAACRQLRPTVDWPDDISLTSSVEQSIQSQNLEDRQPVSWLVVLLINVVVLAILIFLIRIPIQPLCVSQSVSSPSLALVIVLVFHLLWRTLGPIVAKAGNGNGNLNLGPVALPIGLFASIINVAHPWKLSERALWIVAIVLILGAGFLGLSPLSPFQPLEATPIIQSFSVHFQDGTIKSLKPGDVLEVRSNEHMLVDLSVLDQTDTLLCEWFTVTGTQNPGRGCSTVYSLSTTGERDSLAARIESPCKTRQAFAGLHVKLLQSP